METHLRTCALDDLLGKWAFQRRVDHITKSIIHVTLQCQGNANACNIFACYHTNMLKSAAV